MEIRSGSEKRWSRMESLNQNQGLSLLYWMNLWVKDFKESEHWRTSQDRLHYIEKLKKDNRDAILGTLVTDSEGKAAMLLKDFVKKTGL